MSSNTKPLTNQEKANLAMENSVLSFRQNQKKIAGVGGHTSNLLEITATNQDEK